MNTPETYFTPAEPQDYPEVEEGYLPPNAMVHFHFAPHSHEAHFDAAAELLETADIFIPEQSGWTPDQEADWRRIAKASGRNFDKLAEKVIAEDEEYADYTQAMIHHVGGTYKPVLLIDATKKDLPKDMDRAIAVLSRSDYEAELTENYEKAVKFVGLTSTLRERIMLHRLGPAVTGKIREHPKLRDKELVSILVTLGQAHFSVFEHLWDQEATHDQVSASSWSLGGSNEAEEYSERFYGKITANQPVTRNELIAFFITERLEFLIPGLPSIVNRENRLDIQSRNRLLKILLESDLEETGRMVHQLSTGRVLSFADNGMSDSEASKRFDSFLGQAGIDPNVRQK